MKTTPCTDDLIQPIQQYAFNIAPRCGATTRTKKSCKSPAVRGNRRCRMHGGAKGSGAPRANFNARKHGYMTTTAIQERKLMKNLIKECGKFISKYL